MDSVVKERRSLPRGQETPARIERDTSLPV